MSKKLNVFVVDSGDIESKNNIWQFNPYGVVAKIHQPHTRGLADISVVLQNDSREMFCGYPF